jgi:hypothetical protein
VVAKGVVCRTDAFEALCKGSQCVGAGQIRADTSQLQWIFKTLRDREPACIVSAKGIPLLTKREETPSLSFRVMCQLLEHK